MNGDRAAAASHSLEWLQALDAGHRRAESRNILRLVQAVASIFGDRFSEIQQDLIDQS